jgi:hypothetical protein
MVEADLGIGRLFLEGFLILGYRSFELRFDVSFPVFGLGFVFAAFRRLLCTE